ncbi:hypothetical protein OG21DRAFT_1374482, partial [Imleria badia]
IGSEEETDQNATVNAIDDNDSWIDEVDFLSPEERKKLDDTIQPIKTLLVKV